MTACNHQHGKQVWVRGIDDWTGEDTSHYEYRMVSSFQDLDLHRMRCADCGAIKYYSGRAEAFYERGEGELP